jgi:hypothetical protein
MTSYGTPTRFSPTAIVASRSSALTTSPRKRLRPATSTAVRTLTLRPTASAKCACVRSGRSKPGDALAESVIDAVGMVDVDGHPVGTAHLDGEHLDVGQAALNGLGDLALKLSFLLVNLCHLPLLAKNGRGAPISPTGEMWW